MDKPKLLTGDDLQLSFDKEPEKEKENPPLTKDNASVEESLRKLESTINSLAAGALLEFLRDRPIPEHVNCRSSIDPGILTDKKDEAIVQTIDMSPKIDEHYNDVELVVEVKYRGKINTMKTGIPYGDLVYAESPEDLID